MIEVVEFLSGAIMAIAAIIGLFFLRFWRKTGDALFARFAAAFALLAFERVALLFSRVPSEAMSLVYLIRLTAFGLIIWAIVEKNRSARHTS